MSWYVAGLILLGVAFGIYWSRTGRFSSLRPRAVLIGLIAALVVAGAVFLTDSWVRFALIWLQVPAVGMTIASVSRQKIDRSM